MKTREKGERQRSKDGVKTFSNILGLFGFGRSHTQIVLYTSTIYKYMHAEV